MNKLKLLFLFLSLAIAVLRTAVAQEMRDRDVIQGQWKLVELQAFDSTLAKGDYPNFTLIVDGDMMAYQYDNGRKSGGHRFELLPKQKPKKINFSTGVNEGKQDRVGIYTLDDDVLKICFDTVLPINEARRPTEFTTPDGSGRIMMSFNRIKK